MLCALKNLGHVFPPLPLLHPVGSSLAIKISTSDLGDSDICSGDRYKRTGPFFIAKGGDTFEDDLCSVSVFHASTFGYGLTLVPLVRPVRSNRVPEGTARADRTMVEQEVFDLLTEAAPPDPGNLQVVARLSRSGAAVGAGAGAAETNPLSPWKSRLEESLNQGPGSSF